MCDRHHDLYPDHHEDMEFDEQLERQRGLIEQMRDTAKEEGIVFKIKTI